MSHRTLGRSLRAPVIVGFVIAMLFAANAWILPFLIRHRDSLSLGDGERSSCVYRVPATNERLAYSAWVTRLTGFGTAESSLLSSPDSPDGARFLETSRLAKVPERPGPVQLDAAEEFLLPPIVGSGTWGSHRRVVFRGWPFLSAYYEQEDSDTIGMPDTVYGAIVLANPYSGFESSYFIGHLPLRMLPLGLVANALFGAAVGFIAAYAVRLAHRRLRARRGLCPECAYPIPQTAPVSSGTCPECGFSTGGNGPADPV